jgi:hypothetical protein
VEITQKMAVDSQILAVITEPELHRKLYFASLNKFNMNQNTNHEISLQSAIEMTRLYRANRPANFPLSESFDVSAVQKLLATEGAAFLRVYYGMKENDEVDAILVAVNAEGEDILPSATTSLVTSDGALILEDGFRCPEFCPGDSPLSQ